MSKPACSSTHRAVLAVLSCTAFIACREVRLGEGPDAGGQPASAEAATSSSSGSSSGSHSSGGSCAPGVTVACYDGPEGTLGVGVCAAGVATCSADGNGFGPCVGEAIPRREDCSMAADEDCNGSSSCQWVTTLGGPGRQSFLAAAARPGGGIIVVGRNEGELVWSGGTSTSEGGAVLVSAIGANGDVEWLETFGSGSPEAALGVAVSPSGDIAIVGAYSHELTIGPSTLFSGSGEQSAFVATFGPDGTPTAARGFPTDEWGAGFSVAFDSSGGVVASGDVRGTVDLGTGPLLSWGDDIFLVRLDADLVTESAALYGGPNVQFAYTALLPDGDIAMAGGFSTSIELGARGHVGAGQLDTFTALVEPSGNVSWSRADGSAAFERAGAISVDPAGGFLVTGVIDDRDWGTLDFGDATSPIDGNLFVVHFDETSEATWSTALDAAPGIYFELSAPARNDDGFIFVGGEAAGTLTAGAASLDLGSNPEDANAFVLKLDTNGAIVAARRLTVPAEAESSRGYTSSVVVGAIGELYAIGGFAQRLEGPSGIVNATGLDDAFVYRLDW